MPLSVGSPYSEEAIAYVHFDQSPSASITVELRQSGAVMILRESVIPSCVSDFAWFAQSAAEPYGAMKSAVVAPTAVNGAVRSDWPCVYPTCFVSMPAALRPAAIPCPDPARPGAF